MDSKDYLILGLVGAGVWYFFLRKKAKSGNDEGGGGGNGGTPILPIPYNPVVRKTDPLSIYKLNSQRFDNKTIKTKLSQSVVSNTPTTTVGTGGGSLTTGATSNNTLVSGSSSTSPKITP